MSNRIVLSVAAALLATTFVAPAFAEDPGHPRVNEVDQRLDNQQKRVDAGVKDGTITAKQEKRDEKRDAKVEKQMTKDEAKHNGHITKHEQKKLNKELDKNSKDIHKQRKEEEKPATAQ